MCIKIYIYFSALKQNRNNFKNVIFKACKWSKICKYYENGIVISCSTCKKEEKEWMCVKYLIYAVLSWFQICRNLRVFSAKYVFLKFRSSQNNGFFQVWCAISHASCLPGAFQYKFSCILSYIGTCIQDTSSIFL